MDSDTGELAFLPLGGTGEIGMNLNLYRWREAGNEKWLAVDCGIGFGGSELPEVDVMMADPGFIADRRDKLVGLVITHAHEDHIGAVRLAVAATEVPGVLHAVRRGGAAAQAG